MLSKIGLIGASVVLALAVAVAAVWGYGMATRPVSAQAATEVEHKATETITVIGQASVRRAPEIAQISIGVETMGATVGEAVKDSDAKMLAVLAALKAAGIAEKDIQTMNYSIQFERYPQMGIEAPGTQPEPQYRVSNMVNVIVRDLEAVDEVLDAAIEAGANNIWGVTFSLEDPKTAQADARADAIADAKSRAQALADLGGVKLGPVMSISEALGGGVVYSPAVMERAALSAGSISPGEVEIGYQVQVSYFIER